MGVRNTCINRAMANILFMAANVAIAAAQGTVWSQCMPQGASLCQKNKNHTDNTRWRNWVDRTQYMCLWLGLYILEVCPPPLCAISSRLTAYFQCLLLSMYSRNWTICDQHANFHDPNFHDPSSHNLYRFNYDN